MTDITFLGIIPEYCALFILLVIMFINGKKNDAKHQDEKQKLVSKDFLYCELLTLGIIIIDLIRFSVHVPIVEYATAMLFHCSVVLVANAITTYIYDILPSLKEKFLKFYSIKTRITMGVVFIMGLLAPTGLIYGLNEGKVVAGPLYFISFAVGAALFAICMFGAYSAKVSRPIRFTMYLVIICTIAPCFYEVIYKQSVTSGIGFIAGLLLLSGMFHDGVFDMTHGTESFVGIGKTVKKNPECKLLIFTLKSKNDYTSDLSNEIYKVILSIKSQFKFDTLFESNGRYAFIVKKKYFDDIVTLWKTSISEAIKSFDINSIVIDSKYIDSVDMSLLSDVELSSGLRLFTEGDIDKINRKKKIKATLLSIISNEDFQDKRIITVVQPIKDVNSGKFKTGEMLTRLKVDGIDDIVMPGEFIPIVEELKCEHKFNLCVLNSACKLMKQIHAEQLDFDSISVNFDPSELTDKSFVTDVASIVYSNGIVPKCIHIEITESSEISDSSITNKVINELLRLGFSIYLDDFGTKYSNIAELLSAKFDVIKIDRQLILKALDDNAAYKVITALSTACSAVGYKVLFEGVDSDEGIQLACDNNAAYIQGFCYSKPLNWEEFMEFIRTNNKAQLGEKYG